ncbi:hypothetical protein JCM10450v2_002985 [Rhodotorula kratochvilovae]
MNASNQDISVLDPTNSSLRVDRLTRLPPELLKQIVDEAYGEDPPTRPICRALLPFLRECLYRNILVWTSRQLERLGDTVAQVAELAMLVRSLTIDLPDHVGWTHDHPPSDDHFVRLGCRLTRLETLSVRGWPKACALVLSPEMAHCEAFLPALRRLRLLDRIEGCEDLFYPTELAALHHYRNLCDFEAQCKYWNPYTALYSDFPPLPIPLLAFSNITRLSAHVALGPLGLMALLALCPNLSHLSLAGITMTPHLGYLVASLAHPERLRSLELEGFGSWSLAPSVASLTSLEDLSIAGGCDCSTSAFFDLVRLLPLRSLRLGRFLTVDYEALLLLFKGPTRHATISKLVLDTIGAGRMGEWITMDNFDEDDPLLVDYDDEELPVDWEAPIWPPGCDYWAVDDLEHTAMMNGVRATGSTFAALEVEKACIMQRGEIVEIVEYLEDMAAQTGSEEDGEEEEEEEEHEELE